MWLTQIWGWFKLSVVVLTGSWSYSCSISSKLLFFSQCSSLLTWTSFSRLWQKFLWFRFYTHWHMLQQFRQLFDPFMHQLFLGFCCLENSLIKIANVGPPMKLTHTHNPYDSDESMGTNSCCALTLFIVCTMMHKISTIFPFDGTKKS